jgi:predicted TIM-barrel enzyme/DNA-binding NtrC family response regulator
VGAAVGSGMAAHAAEAAGADFILALGAGKMRSMGIPSPASLLPIYDAVNLTLDFAAKELVPRVNLPVYVGLPLFDPRLQVEILLDQLDKLKVSGITNFPAVFHFGERAKVLKTHGLGNSREIAFLAAAKARGLNTIGYIRSRDEASKMVAAGITTLCINFGLNPHSRDTSIEDETLDRLALAAKEIVDSVRKPQSALTVYFGGGPITGGADLEKLCRKAGIDGFIGGSALDRAPLEKSLLNSVASFREIEVLQNRVDRLERRLRRYGKRYGIVCRTDAMDRMLDQVEAVIEGGGHLILKGEPFTDRSKVAEMAMGRLAKKRKGRRWTLDFSTQKTSSDDFFGAPRDPGLRRRVGVLELAGEADIVSINGLETLTEADQNRIAQIILSGEFCCNGEEKTRRCNARFVLIVGNDHETNGVLARNLLVIVRKRAIEVPPLRDRIEDIPVLVKNMISELTEGPQELSPSIARILVRHNWPGNLKELRRVVKWLVEQNDMSISDTQLIRYLGAGPPAAGSMTISQRDRVVQALLLNNLNRTKTADYLGITRKTLYNQIKKYNILT